METQDEEVADQKVDAAALMIQVSTCIDKLVEILTPILRVYKEIMNAGECGEYIGKTDGAIRNLTMRREIPFRKVAGRLVFLKSEIDEWIENSPGVRLEDLEEK